MDALVRIVPVFSAKLGWSLKSVAVFKYGAGTLRWKESKLKDMNEKSRKTMTRYRAFHPKSDMDRLYIKNKEGSRGLMSVERCVREDEIVLICMLPIMKREMLQL